MAAVRGTVGHGPHELILRVNVTSSILPRIMDQTLEAEVHPLVRGKSHRDEWESNRF